jgi:hypothetical protein
MGGVAARRARPRDRGMPGVAATPGEPSGPVVAYRDHGIAVLGADGHLAALVAAYGGGVTLVHPPHLDAVAGKPVVGHQRDLGPVGA